MPAETSCAHETLVLLLVVSVLSTVLIAIVFCCCIWFYLKLCPNPFVSARPSRERMTTNYRPATRSPQVELEMEDFTGRMNREMDRREGGFSALGYKPGRQNFAVPVLPPPRSWTPSPPFPHHGIASPPVNSQSQSTKHTQRQTHSSACKLCFQRQDNMMPLEENRKKDNSQRNCTSNQIHFCPNELSNRADLEGNVPANCAKHILKPHRRYSGTKHVPPQNTKPLHQSSKFRFISDSDSSIKQSPDPTQGRKIPRRKRWQIHKAAVEQPGNQELPVFFTNVRLTDQEAIGQPLPNATTSVGEANNHFARSNGTKYSELANENLREDDAEDLCSGWTRHNERKEDSSRGGSFTWPRVTESHLKLVPKEEGGERAHDIAFPEAEGLDSPFSDCFKDAKMVLKRPTKSFWKLYHTSHDCEEPEVPRDYQESDLNLSMVWDDLPKEDNIKHDLTLTPLQRKRADGIESKWQS